MTAVQSEQGGVTVDTTAVIRELSARVADDAVTIAVLRARVADMAAPGDGAPPVAGAAGTAV